MRILVISDIHANLTALDSVLEDAGIVDEVWFLGDLVGYGPDPNECVERIRGLPSLTCLIGNHDAAVLNKIDLSSFNPEARSSIEWTIEQINPENLHYLAQLPKRALYHKKVTLVHGSPRSPTHEYLLDSYLATINFAFFDTPYCFVGHTHLPVQYSLNNGQGHAQLMIPKENQPLYISERAILNPGSVGQPRDRDPRASYAIFNPLEDTWELRRVAYDIPAVQTRMIKSGLPDRYIVRLTAGW
jgi:diadenosine tetraphosphatase ApaH/serine/threonine PP2A family protein phosphatase